MNWPIRVLVDAGNLRSGGGVQVAASFLDELARLISDPESLARHPWLLESLDVQASSEVVANMAPGSADALGVRCTERRWSDRAIWARQRPLYDVSFSVFGPEYGRARARRRVVGFADGTSLFPSPVRTRWRSRVSDGVRRRVSRLMFRRADGLVVEAAHVRSALHDRWKISPEIVTVVPNTLNGVFHRSDLWQAVDIPATPHPLFGYVTRAYPHKNLSLLGSAAQVLEEEYGLEVRFLLTLNSDEWGALDVRTKAYSINVGPLALRQLPRFYRACTAAFFPSLLECFSVTPLEAMACGVPLVASDRSFVREIAFGDAWYFDPTCANDAARAMAEMLGSPAERTARSARARLRAQQWPDSLQRCKDYLEVIDQMAGTLPIPQARKHAL